MNFNICGSLVQRTASLFRNCPKRWATVWEEALFIANSLCKSHNGAGGFEWHNQNPIEFLQTYRAFQSYFKLLFSAHWGNKLIEIKPTRYNLYFLLWHFIIDLNLSHLFRQNPTCRLCMYLVFLFLLLKKLYICIIYCSIVINRIINYIFFLYCKILFLFIHLFCFRCNWI